MNPSCYYLDTSALIKRYFSEQGSSVMEKLLSKQAFFFTSCITYAEVYSTLHRLCRSGVMPTKNLDVSKKQFEQDWRLLASIEFSQEVRMEIPDLLKQFSLKGADAVHMASIMLLRKRNLFPIMIASDLQLLGCAQHLDFDIINPEHQTRS